MDRAKPEAIKELNKSRQAEALEKLEKVAKMFAALRKTQAEKREAAEREERLKKAASPPKEDRVAPAPMHVRKPGKNSRDQLILGLAEKGMSTRKIVSELAKIGLEVAQRTVVNVINRDKDRE